MQPGPMEQPSNSVAPSTSEPAPTVTSLPMLTGADGVETIVTFSCTLLNSPTEMGAPRARKTAPYHTEAPAPSFTSPASVALGATKL